MLSRRTLLAGLALAPGLARAARAAASQTTLDPAGRIHIPIGIANSLDTLKTFVEAEGGFSPGFGTYGVYFWLYDGAAKRLYAPAMQDVPCRHGLGPDGLLIPWVEWNAGSDVTVRSEICHVQRPVEGGEAQVVAVRVTLRNSGARARKVMLYAAIRPVGPAGNDIHKLEAAGASVLLADGRPALVAVRAATRAGVLETDDVGDLALVGQAPPHAQAASERGDCSGALVYEIDLAPGKPARFEFVCPVLAGRRASRHRWVDLGQDALVDAAPLFDPQGEPQPDPGLAYYRQLNVESLFQQAETYWRELAGRFEISVPDKRWSAATRAILSHAALCMNEGAPDVAVINYNVFNRDGSYVANMFQKSGLFALGEAAVDYFLVSPFNGRAYPEADNPGQVLWTMGQQWLFARDRKWLARVYPSAAKIAAMIEYYRTTPGPHWVNAKSLAFGEALPEAQRAELKPGRCDGNHPEYTEAFDIAGLRSAALLAKADGHVEDGAKWDALAATFLASYRQRFGANLTRDYGSYSVLWPCELYSYSSREAQAQFAPIGTRKPEDWRYFPLATAHQGLLAGNREAGYGTLAVHLAHEQMRGWYAFDEGGGSDSGGWQRARTTWPHNKEKPGQNLSVAMPHGWAIAEFWHLLRDSIAHEDGDALALLPGVAPEWFRDAAGMRAAHLPTHFGELGFDYQPSSNTATLRLTGSARPPGGYELRLPAGLAAAVSADGAAAAGTRHGWRLPATARNVTIEFAS
jgi:hypothetical protein